MPAVQRGAGLAMCRSRRDASRRLAVADYEAGLGDRRLFELEDRTTIALDDEVERASNALSTAAKITSACATAASS